MDGLNNHKEAIWAANWNIGATSEDQIQHLLMSSSLQNSLALRDIALDLNPKMLPWLKTTNGKFNLVTVDWPEVGNTPQQIIALNN